MRASRLLVAVGLALTASGAYWLTASNPDVGAPDAEPVVAQAAADAATRDRPAQPARSDLAGPATPAAPGVAVDRPTRRVRPGRRIMDWDAEPRSGDPATIARAALDEQRSTLALDLMDGELEVAEEFASLSGWHLRLRQTVGGIPVHGSEVSVHVTPDGRPLLIAADVYDLGDAARQAEVSAEVAAATARALVLDAAEDEVEDGAGAPLSTTRAPRLVFRPEEKAARLVWMVDLGTDDESVRVFVDAVHGDAIAVEPLQVAAQGSGRVFMPNPVYSRRDSTLRDQGDKDQGVLTDARVFVTLERLDGSGFLKGDWADVTATANPASSGALVFSGYTRDDPRFEQVNAYFHVDRAQQRLQDLGITNANASPQRVNAHARADDQSVYDILNDVLEFGDGGVDDAEDGDIVVHEYGHALQHAQRPNFGLSGEAGAMGEGFADFFAVAFHDANDVVFDPAVASWDAVSYSGSNPPALRRVDGNKHYPTDVSGFVHDDGEIWSGFLWDLRGLLGNDESLRLVVESHPWLAPASNFRDGANAILLVNASLRSGADDAGIRDLLRARGLPFTVAPPATSEDDDFEDNDTFFSAASLDVGTHRDLLLADEDWYRITVPAFARVFVLATFDADEIDLDLEARDAAAGMVASSRSVGSSEQIELSAAETPRDYFLRVFDGSTGVGSAGYELTVSATELAILEPKVMQLLDLDAAASQVFRVVVPLSKTTGRKRLRVKTRRVGKDGALTELRVLDPLGVTVAEFSDTPKRRGAKVKVRPTVAGAWVVEIRPRDGTTGTVKVKANFVR